MWLGNTFQSLAPVCMRVSLVVALTEYGTHKLLEFIDLVGASPCIHLNINNKQKLKSLYNRHQAQFSFKTLITVNLISLLIICTLRLHIYFCHFWQFRSQVATVDRRKNIFSMIFDLAIIWLARGHPIIVFYLLYGYGMSGCTVEPYSKTILPE